MDQPTTTMQETREKLRSHFSGDVSDRGAAKWSALWEQNFTPWDQGVPHPALRDTLADPAGLFTGSPFVDEAGKQRRKRALVPGCGKGYDVALLASFGYDAYGLDVAEKAVEEARKLTEAEVDKYPLANEEYGRGKATFLKVDFFSKDWEEQIEGGPTFEIIFDYTFLCALNPSLRPSWALRMSQLLGDGRDNRLICHEFPTYKDPALGGPPHGLPQKVYVGHLSRPGVELSYDENSNLNDDEAKVEPVSNGLSVVKRWQPERTHELGKGTDWVSVWKKNSSN